MGSTSGEDRRWVVLNVMCMVLSLAIPAFAVRAYVKLQVNKLVSADDWMISLTGIFYVVYIVCQIAACINGFGAHTSDLPETTSYHNGDVVEALRFWFLATLFNVLTTSTIRISIALFISRQPTFHPFRWLLVVVILLSTIVSAAFFFLLLFQCRPIADFWSRNRSDVARSCFHHVMIDLWYAFTAVSTALDVVLAGFAVAALLERGATWRKRAMVAVVNGFTAIAVIASAMKIVYVPGLTDAEDLTWSATNFAIWALLGPTMGVVAANLATIGPWLKELGMNTAHPSYNITWQQDRNRGRTGREMPTLPAARRGGHDVEGLGGIDELDGRWAGPG